MAASTTERPLRAAVLASVGTLVGIVLSGPPAVALVTLAHPQPRWENAALYTRTFHPLQQAPYLGGLVLVSALVLLISSLHALALQEQRALTGAALIFTGVFATMIFFNYVAQLSFVPVLVTDFVPESAGAITALSMVNPRSLAWDLEMWGWGFFGVASWLVAGVFHGSRLEQATSIAFTANGPVSIAGALLTVAWPGWVMTPLGLAMSVAWNVLLAVMAVLALIVLRRRLPKREDQSVVRIPPRPEHLAHEP